MIKERFGRLSKVKGVFALAPLTCALVVALGAGGPNKAHAQTTPPDGYIQLAQSTAPAPWGWVELRGYFFQTVAIPHAPIRRSINWWIIGDWDPGANGEYNGYQRGWVDYESLWHPNDGSTTDFFVPTFNGGPQGGPRFFWNPPIAVADYNPYTSAPSYFVQYTNDRDDMHGNGYYYPVIRLNFNVQGTEYSFLAGPFVSVSF